MSDLDRDDDEKRIMDEKISLASFEVRETGVAVDAAERSRIIDRIKFMNKVGDTVDQDPLADAASHFIYDRLMEMSLEEATEVLSKAYKEHCDDVNFPSDALDRIERMLRGREAYGIDSDVFELDCKLKAVVIKFHSPYPEVRAVTDPFDDPTIPVETLRAYLLGAIWVAISSFVNQLFYERQPRLNLAAIVLQLFLFPCGKFAQLLPDWGITFRGTRYTINPGPWTHKEQMFATVMVSAGSQMSNFMSISIAMRSEKFFNLEWVDFGFIFLTNLSSLFFGYGLAGLARKLAIYPVKAVFPTVLPTLALNRALLLKETKTSISGWTISRQKFFFLTFALSFIYFFFPTYLFNALSTFNWMTWIAPQNVKVALVTGSFLGMGINPIPTFDWSIINYSTPLVLPYFANVNRFIGVILSGFALMVLYWTNTKYTAYLPPNANTIYDNTGAIYSLSRILDSTGHFDLEKFKAYSVPYMTAGHLVGTGTLWALYTCAFTYICISEYKLIVRTGKLFYNAIRHPHSKASDDFDDPHSRMMRAYPEVPDWWYLAIFLIAGALAIITITAWPTTVPVWTVICIFLFNIGMYIPTIIVYSVTGYAMGFGAFSVFIAGYMDPGNAVTNILVRLWGFNVDEQSETFIADQKMAHYAKLPQRAVFRAQLVATLIQTFATLGAVEALFKTVADFCSATQQDKFICLFPRSVYSDAIMFGILGTDRVLSTLYPALKHCFYIGPLTAIPFAIMKLKRPQKVKNIFPPLIWGGATFWGYTYNFTYYIGGFYAATAFMFYLRRYYTAWWTKYNYILASGLTAGVAFSGVVIFLALQYTQTTLSWWGNNVVSAGVDYARVATLKEVPEGGFGLKVGEFS